MDERPGVGVGVIVFRDPSAREVLVIRRGKAPAHGLWAPPGGRVEWGETVHEAAAREVLEETGLRVRVPADGSFTSVDVLERGEGGEIRFHFVLVQVFAWWEGEGAAVAGDDAVECQWWPVERLHELQPQVEEIARVVALARERLATSVWESQEAGSEAGNSAP